MSRGVVRKAAKFYFVEENWQKWLQLFMQHFARVTGNERILIYQDPAVPH